MQLNRPVGRILTEVQEFADAQQALGTCLYGRMSIPSG